MPKTSARDADWNALAQEAMRLWQEHLDAYAADPQIKADMARLVAPMSRMFAEWQTMMQHGGHGTGFNGQQGAGADKAAGGGANAAGARGVVELTDRVAELERQIDELESRLSGDAGAAAEPVAAAKRGKPARKTAAGDN